MTSDIFLAIFDLPSYYLKFAFLDTNSISILIKTEHEWRHPLLNMPTFLFSSAPNILM